MNRPESADLYPDLLPPNGCTAVPCPVLGCPGEIGEHCTDALDRPMHRPHAARYRRALTIRCWIDFWEAADAR